MKNKINVFGLLIFLLFVSLNAKTPYFYYYNGTKQYLELDKKRVFISVTDKTLADTLGLRQQTFRVDIVDNTQSRTDYPKRVWAMLVIEDSLSDEAYFAKLSEIKNKGRNIITAPYFKNQSQNEIGLSNFFYVKLKSLSDTILLKQEAKKERAVIAYQNQFMPMWFVVSVTASSKYNAMELANRFFESGLFQYAEPDLMVDDKINCANDTHFGNQWNLKNVGQYGGTNGIDIKACDAWQVATGSNVIIAVLDDGIQLDHPDLASNIYPLSYDSELNQSPQGLLYGSHGTSCAGIIGAVKNNAKHITGVAPNCKLMAVSNSFSSNPTSRMKRADGINWAWQNGADIISNSWGSEIAYQVIDDAISNAVTFGRVRNGVSLGCVVVFASGNDNGGNGTTVSYPGSLPIVITVGAISQCGERKSLSSCDGRTGITNNWGSNYGNMLNVVAPGVNIPTTITNNTYTLGFVGTSAAAPHVAGIAALILSINPNLTRVQVTNIIESTARKVGAYTYSNTSGHPNGQWNNEMGYGLVDAYAAVQAACATLPSAVNFINQTVTATTNLNSCGNINIQNTTVTSTGVLNVRAGGTITINSPFNTAAGSSLILQTP